MEKLKVKPAVGPTTVFTVYRPNNQNVQISGPSISVEIKDGSLLVLSGGNSVTYVFSPGQWLTVNIAPV